MKYNKDFNEICTILGVDDLYINYDEDQQFEE
jgi:hypothetical protein